MDSLSEIKKHIEFLTYRKLQNSKTRILCTSHVARKFQIKKHRRIIGGCIRWQKKERLKRFYIRWFFTIPPIFQTFPKRNRPSDDSKNDTNPKYDSNKNHNY